MRVLWVLLALLGGVGAGIGVFVLLAGRGVKPAAPVVEPAQLGATVSVSASASASAGASASAVAADAPEAASAPEDSSECLRAFFSKDAFVAKAPSLRFVCEGAKPKDIASRLRVAVVDSAGGHVSDSMKEWSQLGFYELAVVAMLRGRCCGAVKALELPAAQEGCDSVGEALEAIASASRPGGDGASLDRAVERFDGDVRCAIRLKRAATYGYSKVLPGEASVFGKIRARMKP